MKSTRIDISEYSAFNEIVGDFLSQRPEIESYGPSLYSIKSVEEAISDRKGFPVDRTSLCNVIRSQYQESGIDLSKEKKLASQISLLEDENTYSVTTGHQLCLFTGPLYFPIKILQVIRMADDLNRELKGSKVVPVFWMASEDHDFEEINHVHLFNQTLEWKDYQGGMVGDYSCDTISDVLKNMTEILGDSENALSLKELFSKAYRSGNSLSAATRILVHHLFGEKGLVIVDGNSAELKQLFIPYLKKEIEGNETFNAVQETNSSLSKKYKIQVNPRVVNLFYLRPNSRLRIDVRDGEYFTEGGEVKWNQADLVKEMVDFPSRFSPNVILRPVYQEVILPNIAYVGGPGELAYWLQLKKSFAGFKVPYPLLSLRNNFIWLDKAKNKKLEKLGLDLHDLFKDETVVVEKLVNFKEDAGEIESELTSVKDSFNLIAEKLTVIDPSLKGYVLAEGRKAEKQLDQLKKKLIRAKKDKNKELLESYWNLKEKVFPKGNLHERYDNFVPYYLKHGPGFFDQLYMQVNPLDSRLCVISE